ncbi:MAG: DegT/DnrJ/EryC1/StrS aminotransferase family protein [Nitrospirae bacterium]|nr:DegT/DnrJ/EryC1/StrS aminotransferase family protein [Nitrospirota bacterium]
MRKEFIPIARPYITEEEINAVTEVLWSGWWTTGPKVTEFENEVVTYLNHDDNLYAVALNSCTAGLHLALLTLGIGEGDEVIVPTWTFAATAEVVEWVGAKLLLCDVEEGSLNIDVYKAEKLITERTKAIMPVHIAGYPCNMDAIGDLAEKYGLTVIEDAAHAMGTMYKGVKTGNFSKVTVFSFYTTKNLATGEGGMVVSKDKELIERIRKLSYFGINKEAFKRYEKMGTWFYDIEEIGYKNNFDNIHAALGLVQLKKLDTMNKIRRKIARRYREMLSTKFKFTEDSQEHYHSYHLFLLRVPIDIIGRDELIDKLKKLNIGTSVHYRPLHLHSHYRNRFSEENFQVANKIFPEILSIPLFPSMHDDDVEYVINNLNALVGS